MAVALVVAAVSAFMFCLVAADLAAVGGALCEALDVYVVSISKSSVAQQARRLVFTDVFSIDEVSKGTLSLSQRVTCSVYISPIFVCSLIL